MKACLYAGINLSGVNAEVMPSQWEYQVGPATGIESGDQMWMSRYILLRCAELYNVEVTLDPKPIPGDWNGAGGHVNFSNNDTRAPEVGWANIQKQIEKIGKRHGVHIAAYGEGNERRLTGKHETSSMDDFSWGVADRGCSIRVGRMVPVEKSGYYEDRRPASNLVSARSRVLGRALGPAPSPCSAAEEGPGLTQQARRLPPLPPEHPSLTNLPPSSPPSAPCAGPLRGDHAAVRVRAAHVSGPPRGGAAAPRLRRLHEAPVCGGAGPGPRAQGIVFHPVSCSV
jgi:hypothetical protein